MQTQKGHKRNSPDGRRTGAKLSRWKKIITDVVGVGGGWSCAIEKGSPKNIPGSAGPVGKSLLIWIASSVKLFPFRGSK